MVDTATEELGGLGVLLETETAVDEIRVDDGTEVVVELAMELEPARVVELRVDEDEDTIEDEVAEGVADETDEDESCAASFKRPVHT